MKIFVMSLVLTAACFAEAEHHVDVDYMKLTRKSMPHMQCLVQGAINHLDVHLDTDALTRGIKMGAFLPRFTARASYNPDGIDSYDQLNYGAYSRYNVTDGYTESTRSVSEDKQTGYDSRTDWGVSLEWDLTRLIHSNDERTLTSRRVQKASLVRRRTVDIARRYALLMGALPVDENEEADPGKMAIILENATILDVWTDGMLTQTLLTRSSR